MLIEEAPILEYDDDSAEPAKKYFFRQGKKDFSELKKCTANGVDRCILFLPRSFDGLKDIKKKCVKIYEFKAASTVSPVYLYDQKVLIALCPLGGPAAANLMEELDYVGIKKFIACGTCGCLRKDFNLNKFFIPTSAIRDEGLSYHYIIPAREIAPAPSIVKALKQTLTDKNIPFYADKTWTIDAIYRETPNRIKRRLEEGAVAVEMECASLAAVAKYNKAQFGALLYFSDIIDGKEWQWRIYDKIIARTTLVELSIEAILKL